MKKVSGTDSVKRWKRIACMAGMAVFLSACGNSANENAADKDAAQETTEQSTGYRDDVAAADLQAAVAEKMGDNYWPDMEVPPEMIEDTFGISADLYDEAFAQVPMISANVDTLIIVKAKEGSEGKVEEALQAYKEYNTTEALQYPMNLGKVQAAQIAVYGRYVCFVQLGAQIPETEGADGEESDAAAILHCEQENAKALAVIEDMLKK